MIEHRADAPNPSTTKQPNVSSIDASPILHTVNQTIAAGKDALSLVKHLGGAIPKPISTIANTHTLITGIQKNNNSIDNVIVEEGAKFVAQQVIPLPLAYEVGIVTTGIVGVTPAAPVAPVAGALAATGTYLLSTQAVKPIVDAAGKNVLTCYVGLKNMLDSQKELLARELDLPSTKVIKPIDMTQVIPHQAVTKSTPSITLPVVAASLPIAPVIPAKIESQPIAPKPSINAILSASAMTKVDTNLAKEQEQNKLHLAALETKKSAPLQKQQPVVAPTPFNPPKPVPKPHQSSVNISVGAKISLNGDPKVIAQTIKADIIKPVQKIINKVVGFFAPKNNSSWSIRIRGVDYPGRQDAKGTWNWNHLPPHVQQWRKEDHLAWKAKMEQKKRDQQVRHQQIQARLFARKQATQAAIEAKKKLQAEKIASRRVRKK